MVTLFYEYQPCSTIQVWATVLIWPFKVRKIEFNRRLSPGAQKIADFWDNERQLSIRPVETGRYFLPAGDREF